MGGAATTDLGDGVLRALFDTSPRPMWRYDEERLALIAVNDAASMLYGPSELQRFVEALQREGAPASDRRHR